MPAPPVDPPHSGTACARTLDPIGGMCKRDRALVAGHSIYLIIVVTPAQRRAFTTAVRPMRHLALAPGSTRSPTRQKYEASTLGGMLQCGARRLTLIRLRADNDLPVGEDRCGPWRRWLVVRAECQPHDQVTVLQVVRLLPGASGDVLQADPFSSRGKRGAGRRG